MADQKKSKKEAATVKIYSRVRKLMPWEPTKISVKIMDQETVHNVTDKKTSQYTFTHIFNMQKTNEDIYRIMGKPLVRKVLEGFNAVLIAYGQTGSGKTHTLVGKPEQGVKGVLPFMLEELLNNESVKQLSVSGCEAYGTHVSRIELFDLFAAENVSKDWALKKGSGGLEPKQCTSRGVSTLQACWDRINQAHDASHFAPTGKNPESSRGHVAFCTKVEQEDGQGGLITSYLIVVDLAGSEGESAFTPDFVKKVDPPTLMARRLEAGCINTGLSQLQVVFNELKVKGRLTKSRGNGLRRILHAYINQNCMISVMFTLSPAYTNRVTTESTLKFAVQAGMVKVQPVKAKAKINYKALVEELQKHVEEQAALVEKLNDDIERLDDRNADLEFKIRQLNIKASSASSSSSSADNQDHIDDDENMEQDAAASSDEPDGGYLVVETNADAKLKAKQQNAFRRQESKMPQRLQTQINLFHEAQTEQDEDGFVELSLEEQKSCVAIDISAARVDSDIKRIHQARKTVGVDMELLNASIRRTTTLASLRSDLLSDDDIQNAANSTPTPATFATGGASGGSDDDDPDNVPTLSDMNQRQNTLKQSLTNQSNTFDEAQNEQKEQDDGFEAGFLTFQTRDTSAMTKEELVEYADELESKLIEERTLRYGLQKSQQVIIDHLMETNEALLRWFKIKKIL